MFQEENTPNKVFMVILLNDKCSRLYEITLPAEFVDISHPNLGLKNESPKNMIDYSEGYMLIASPGKLIYFNFDQIADLNDVYIGIRY